MAKEDYVSYETAKLLKEKGFDWEESPFYSEQDRDEWRQNAWYIIPNPCYDKNIPFDTPTLYVIAPHVSFQKAMKWLREKHNRHISIEHSYILNKYKICITKYNPNNISDLNNTLYNSADYDFSTYEEACEAAIKYTLENLI